MTERHADLEPQDLLGIAISAARCHDPDGPPLEEGSLGAIEADAMAVLLWTMWSTSPEAWTDQVRERLDRLTEETGGKWLTALDRAIDRGGVHVLSRAFYVDTIDSDSDEHDDERDHVHHHADRSGRLAASGGDTVTVMTSDPDHEAVDDPGAPVPHDGYTPSDLSVDSTTIRSATRHALRMKGYDFASERSNEIVPMPDHDTEVRQRWQRHGVSSH